MIVIDTQESLYTCCDRETVGDDILREDHKYPGFRENLKPALKVLPVSALLKVHRVIL
jgi:hypothetical protein